MIYKPLKTSLICHEKKKHLNAIVENDSNLIKMHELPYHFHILCELSINQIVER